LLLLFCLPSLAQRMKVRIIQRSSSETTYNYVVPGFSNSNASGSLNCYGSTCYGSTRSSGTSTSGYAGSYAVSGATFSLALPDGRVAVVNCDSKGWGRRHRRSCRTPLVNDIEADFKGKDAKLIWPVSLDGRKTESETYKILTVLAAQL
jgi:hypothetical protein